MSNTFTYTTVGGERKTLRLMGHKLLIRQCATDESRWLVGTPKGKSDSLSAAMLKSWSKETPGSLYHILAMGDAVGQARPADFWRRYRSAEVVRNTAEFNGRVGDFVVIPRISHMPGLWFRWVAPVGHEMREVDFLCDECVVQAVIPDDWNA